MFRDRDFSSNHAYPLQAKENSIGRSTATTCGEPAYLARHFQLLVLGGVHGLEVYNNEKPMNFPQRFL